MINYLTSRRKFAAEEIFFSLLMLCVVPIQMLESPLYTLLQYLTLAACVGYMALRLRTWWKKDVALFAALGMGVAIILSATINAAGFWQIREAVFYAAVISLLFPLLKLLANNGKLPLFLAIATAYLAGIVLLNDALMLLMPSQFYNVDGRAIGTMLLGNKFTVAYTHLLLTVFVALHEKRDKTTRMRTLAMAALSFVIALYVDCMTVALGSVVFAVLTFMPPKARRVLSNPYVFLGVFAACAFGVFLLPYIVSWGPVTFILEDILHRDITLTGRLDIYVELPEIFLEKPFLGFGYMNMPVRKYLLWYANAQNALLDFLLNYGVITALGLGTLCFDVISRRTKAAVNAEKTWGIRCMLYAFVFIGIVEVVYSTTFFFLLALLYAVSALEDKTSALPQEPWRTLPTDKVVNPRACEPGLVSVIIPVYNVEDYLNHCVETAVAQTYPNLEILLVDDGSPDNSGKLCDQWAQKDSRITVIHKQNGGLSSARNAGLAAAKGEFILFIDSDDWMAPDMAEKMVAGITATNADLVCCGMTAVEDGIEYPLPWFGDAIVLDAQTALQHVVNNDKLSSHVVPKMYRASMLENDIFPLGKLFEDVLTTHKVLARCATVAIIPDAPYYYYQRSDSITNVVRLRNRFGWIDALKERYLDIGHLDDAYAESLLSQMAEQLALTYVQNAFSAEELAEYRARRLAYDRWLRERQTGSIVYRYISKKNYVFYLTYQLLGENANWLYQLLMKTKDTLKWLYQKATALRQRLRQPKARRERKQRKGRH